MGFGRNIADLSVGIGVDDAEFQAEMRAAEARAMGMLRRIDGSRAEATITADLKQLEAKEKRAEAILDRWRRKKAEATLDVDVKKADAQVKRWETRMRNLTSRRHELKLELNDRQATSALGRVARELRRTKKDTDEGERSFRKLFSSLTSMTLRLGPFTAQVQQFARALLVAGPVVQGLVAALGGMVSVLGAGVIGAVGLGSAALAGMALSGIGLMYALKPLKQHLAAVRKAQDAYTASVQKYGAESDKAKKKQAQLNSVLGHISPAAKQAFRDMNKVRDAWIDLTKPTRRAAMEALGQGLKTLEELMPQLAKRTNQTAHVLEVGFTRAMKALRGDGGKSVLDTIFGGFNASLPHFLAAFQSLGTAAGRFVAAFAGSPLSKVASDFERFAASVERASRNADGMAHLADVTTKGFESTIHVLSAATKVLFEFFRAGLGPGGQFVDGLANSMDKLAQKMSTVQGQASLRNWFGNGIETTRLLFAALKPLLSMFVQLTDIMLPFANVALKLSEALASITHAGAGLPGVGSALQAVFGYELFRSLPLINRFLPSITKLFSLGKKGAIGKLGIAGLGAEAGGGALAVGGLARVLGALRGASMGARFGLAGVAASIALMALNAYGAKSPMQQLHDQFDKLGDSAKDNSDAYVTLRGRLADVGSNLHHTRDSLRQAKEELANTKKGTVEHSMALQTYRDALRTNVLAQRDWTAGSKMMKDAAEHELTAQEGRLRTFDKAHKAQIADLQTQRMSARTSAERQGADFKLNMLADRRAKLLSAVEKAHNREAAAALNSARVYRGLLPIVGQTEQALGKLARSNPNIAKKISVKFDTPKDVGGVTRAAQSALGAGVSVKRVLKIVGDSKNAEAAIHRLNAAKVGAKKVRISAEDLASASIRRIAAIAFSPKRVIITAAAAQAMGQIQAVQNLMASLHDKTLTISILRSSQAIPAGKNARGRGPGQDELSLVGEGHGPELVADPASGRSALVTQPTIMSLPRSAYVIPDAQDAGGNRQQRLFAEAARAMGIPGFKKGKKPRFYHAPAKMFSFGAFPDDKVKEALDHEDQKLSSLKDKLKHKKATTSQVQKEQALVNRLRGDYQRAHGFTSKIDLLETRLNTAGKAMDNANTAGNEEKWKGAHKRRQSIIKQLIGAKGEGGLLNRALGLSNKYHQTSYSANLASKIEELRGDLLDNKSATFSPDAAGEAPTSLEDFLKSVGMLDTYKGLRLKLSEAQGTEVTSDDATALTDIQGFLDTILGRGDLSVDARIDTQDTRNSIHSELAGLAPDTSSDDQARIDQLQTQLTNAQNEAAINAAFAQVAGGPGDIGTGGFSSARQAASGHTFIINTLHPGDSKTLRAIGDASAAGFGFQPSRTSPRLFTGL